MERYGLKFGNPDFVKLAESFGAHGFYVDMRSDFERILQESKNISGLKVINLPFDYPKKIQ